MVVKQRIMQILGNYPDGIDDDDLARVLNLSNRQHANSCCRELEKEGLLVRRPVNGKIHNFLAGNIVQIAPAPIREIHQNESKFDDWFWEGNVQTSVGDFLVSQGFCILSTANTATHQQGIDIVAEKGGKHLWVSVKGYPRKTEKTNPSVQAGHYFKECVFDMVEYRERDKNVVLGIALPDFPRYRKMAARITWLKPVARFSYFWVGENGEVVVE